MFFANKYLINKYLLVAITGHAFIFACLIFSFHFHHDEIKIAAPFLPSYFYQSSNSPPLNNSVIKKYTAKMHINSLKNLLDKPIVAKVKSNASQAHHEEQYHQPITTDKFLSSLHFAIASQQYYPDSALELKQHGSVVVRFLLYPDGHIENVTIIQSSQIESIDLAAKQAVFAISPFKMASEYLHAKNEFTVTIVFA